MNHISKTALILAQFILSLSIHAQWTQIPTPSLPLFNIFDIYQSESTLVAVGYKTDINNFIFQSVILTSIDAGENWNETYQNDRFLKTIDFNSNGDGYIGGFGLGADSYILTSVDDGHTWSDHVINLSKAGISQIRFNGAFEAFACGYDSVQFSSAHVFKSDDGGETWASYSTSTPANTTFDKLSFTENRMYAVSSVFGSGTVLGKEISMSDDGGLTWSLLHTNSENLGGMAWIDDNVGFIITESGRIQKTIDGGSTWSQVYSTNGNGLFAITLNAEVGYAVGSEGIILKTEDSGETWSTEESGTSKTLVNVRMFEDAVYVSGEDGLILRHQINSDTSDTNNSNPTSIDLIANTNAFQVYPNPAINKKITVSANTNNHISDLIFSVFDPTGQLITTRKMNKNNCSFTLSELSANQYWYRITSAVGEVLQTGQLIMIE